MEILSGKSEVGAFDILFRTASALAADLPAIGLFSGRRRYDCFISICRRLDDLAARGELSVADTQRILILMSAQSARARKAIARFEATARYLTAQGVAALPRSAREYYAALRSFETGRGILYPV